MHRNLSAEPSANCCPGGGSALSSVPALLDALGRDDLFAPWYMQQHLPHSSFVQEQEEDINVTDRSGVYFYIESLSWMFKSLFLSLFNSREPGFWCQQPAHVQTVSDPAIHKLSSTTAQASTKPDVLHEWPQAEPLQWGGMEGTGKAGIQRAQIESR